MWEVHRTIDFQGVHHEIPATLGKGAKGQARSVGRNSGRECDRAHASDLVLVRSVVIHRPDFFVTSAVTDEINLSLGDSLDAATEPDDDFVRKFVGHHPGCSVSGSVRVLLPANLRGLDTLDVV